MENIFTKSSFNPKFEFTTSIKDAADCALRGHEDYFLNLNNIYEKMMIDSLEYFDDSITFGDACNLQKMFYKSKSNIMNLHSALGTPEMASKIAKLPNKGISLGMRNLPVKVNGEECPVPFQVVRLIHLIFPLKIKDLDTIEKMEDWYRKFAIIHPFNDLNGRVSSLIVNIISFTNYQKWLIRKF